MAKKIIAFLLFTVAAVSGFAQTNASLNCGSGIFTTEADGTGNTDDGHGSLRVGTSCQVVPYSTTASFAYLTSGWVYLAPSPIVLKNAVDISSVTGRTATDGRAAGWIFVLEVDTGIIVKRFELAINSVAATGAGAQLYQTWPLALHIPAGSKVSLQVYAFADNASTCSAFGCFSNGIFTLQ